MIYQSDERSEYIENVTREAFDKLNLKERVIKEGKEGYCFNPSAKCHVTKKPLFARKCIKVKCAISTPLSGFFMTYYFTPKQYTLWCLKSAVK